MKDSGVEWIGEIPVDWEMKKVKSFLRERSEKDHANEEVLSLYRDYGVIPKNSRTDNHNVTSQDTSSYKFVKKDNVVINKMKAWQGSLAVSKYQGIISPAYYIYEIKNTEEIVPEFLHYVLRNPLYTQEYKRLSAGLRVGQWDLNKSEFNSLLYPIPSIKVQIKIVSYLNEKIELIDKIVEDTKQSIEELKKYKRFLITEAVTKGLDKNVDMKESGVEWIGKIPSNWKLCRLKNILISSLQYGANESGIAYNPDYPRYIRITDIQNNNTLSESNKLSLEPETAEPYLLEEGDLLFARSGATVGKTFLIEKENDNDAFAGYLIRARFSKQVVPKYVFYYTNSSIYDEWKESIAIQATIQNIGADKYANLPITIPTIDDQKHIVEFLEGKIKKIDLLINNKFGMISEYEKYKKSLICEYVTGKKEV